MKIHALTLSWNGREYLEALKETLFPTALKTPHQIIWYIRDNCSVDKTHLSVLKWAHTAPIHTALYPVSHNKANYAEGNNFLFNKAKPVMDIDNDLILFLNNDIVIEDFDSINNMIKLMKPDVGVVGSRLLYPDRTVQHGGVTFKREHGGLPHHYNVDDTISKEMQAVTFAFALVRAKCIMDLQNNKLDEKYNWCFDDSTTCLDILYRQKMKVVYCADTTVIHNESASLKKNPINGIYESENFRLFRQEWKNIVVFDDHLYQADKNYKVIK